MATAVKQARAAAAANGSDVLVLHAGASWGAGRGGGQRMGGSSSTAGLLEEAGAAWPRGRAARGAKKGSRGLPPWPQALRPPMPASLSATVMMMVAAVPRWLQCCGW